MESDSIFIICVTIMMILCLGDPDILDGLIHFLNK